MANQNLLYQIANPKIADIQGQYAAGQQQQNALAEIARGNEARALYGQAAGGDQNALAGLAGVDPALHQASVTARQKQTDIDKAKADEANRVVAAVLGSATSPEQYQAAIAHLEQNGAKFDPWEKDPANQQQVIASLSEAKDVLGSQRKIGEAEAEMKLKGKYEPDIEGAKAKAKSEAEFPNLLKLKQAERANALAPTPSQQANNAEISAARRFLAGRKPEDIRLASTKADEFGFENKEYDPRVARAANLAIQRMVGEDAGFKDATRMIYGGPEPLPVVNGKVDPAGLTAGKVYADPSGKEYIWNGQGFEEAN